VTDVKKEFDTRPGGGGPLDSLGFLLSQLGFIAAKRFQAVLEPLGIDPRSFLLLRFILREEGQSQQALGETLRIPPSRMVAVVDGLEERGLVERRPNPSDRRARALYVTAEGRRLLGEAVKIAMEHEARVGASLTPDERRQVIALLQKLAAEMNLLSGVHPGLTVENAQDD
jgi:DNA-binding MarR family transcriptional regulator